MAWTNYVNTGPFTNNTVPPSINATFLNNIETFLDQIVSSVAGDSGITSGGSGNLFAHDTHVSGSLFGTGGTLTVGDAVTANNGLKGVLTSKGGGHTLTDWNFGTTTANNGGTTVTHGIKNASGVATTPTVIFCTLDNFAVGDVVQADSAGSTTFRVSTNGATTRTIWWLALLA